MATVISIIVLIVLIVLAIKVSFFSNKKNTCAKGCDGCSSNKDGKCALNNFSLDEYYKDQKLKK